MIFKDIQNKFKKEKASIVERYFIGVWKYEDIHISHKIYKTLGPGEADNWININN